MIVSFKDKNTKRLFDGENVRTFPSELQRIAQRKLQYINAAIKLSDLRMPPGNRLEPLKGNYKGFHSIRINDQFRIIFNWQGNDAHDVQVIDYHKG